MTASSLSVYYGNQLGPFRLSVFELCIRNCVLCVFGIVPRYKILISNAYDIYIGLGQGCEILIPGSYFLNTRCNVPLLVVCCPYYSANFEQSVYQVIHCYGNGRVSASDVGIWQVLKKKKRHVITSR